MLNVNKENQVLESKAKAKCKNEPEGNQAVCVVPPKTAEPKVKKPVWYEGNVHGRRTNQFQLSCSRRGVGVRPRELQARWEPSWGTEGGKG